MREISEIYRMKEENKPDRLMFPKKDRKGMEKLNDYN